jgi:hypothetical protein
VVLFCFSNLYQVQNPQHARMNGSKIISKSLLSWELFKFFRILKLRTLQFEGYRISPIGHFIILPNLVKICATVWKCLKNKQADAHSSLQTQRYSNARVMPVENSMERLHLSCKLYCCCLQIKYSLIETLSFACQHKAESTVVRIC